MIVADGRSPITASWLKSLAALGFEVVLVSTYPCQPLEGLSEQHIFPVAFAGLGGSQSAHSKGTSGNNRLRPLVSRFRSIFMAGRYYFGPWQIKRSQPAFIKLIEEIKPDIIHALRIPYEGMLASCAPADIPLAVSVWGNDLTLHAKGSPWMKNITRQTLTRADVLMADASRDIRLGKLWGFDSQKMTLVVPGNGGLDLSLIPDREKRVLPFLAGIPGQRELVVNPRGFRPGSVRNDIFFYSMPLILQRNPNVHFVLPAMAGQAQAYRWVRSFHLEDRVRLLPVLPQDQLWNLFSQSAIFASISSHDGTPNSFLESAACGCFPVVGDIESLREWVVPGVNGFLVEPDRPQQVAEAILQALENTKLRDKAGSYNRRMIKERVSVEIVREKIRSIYQKMA